MKRIITTILLIVLAIVLLGVGFLGVVALTPWGQSFVTAQVNGYLKKKIKEPFAIGRVRYKLPDWIELEGVYFVTPQKDTLLSGRRMRVDVDMLGLLRNRVMLNQIELEGIRANITRTLPDTAFNFQYIIDAFNTGKPEDPTKAQAADTTATPLDLNIRAAKLKDVRITYRDDVVGTDLNAFVDSLRADFDEINVNTSSYRIKELTGDGLNVKARIYEGLPKPDTVEAPTDTLRLGLGKWALTRTNWDVRVENADFATTGKVGRLAVENDFFYLKSQRVGLKSIQLTNSDISATLLRPVRKISKPNVGLAKVTGRVADATGKTATAKQLSKAEERANAAVAKASGDTATGWCVQLGTLALAQNRLRFDDETKPKLRRGLDYSHLDLQDLNLTGRGILYSPERSVAQVRQGRFRDKSGFTLQRLDGDVVYGEKGVSLNRLLVQTKSPGSIGTLLRDRVVLSYDSIGQLSRPREASRVKLLVNLQRSRLAVADILALAPFLETTPPFAGNRRAVINVNALLTGTMANLNVPTFQLAMLSGTRINARGRLTNLLDTERMGVDLAITEASTRKADLNKLLPRGTLPDSIGLPPSVRLTGRLRGTLNNLSPDLNVATDWGRARFTGTLGNFVTGRGQTYRGTLALNSLDLGKFLMQPKQYGKVTGTAQFNGRGLDYKTLATTFKLNVREANYGGYRYQNVVAQGTLNNGALAVNATSADPNARLALSLRSNLKSEFPSAVGEVDLSQLDVTALGFYKDPLLLKGRIKFNFTSTDPKRPNGTLSTSGAVITLNGKSYNLDSVYVKAETGAGLQKRLVAQTPFARLALNGQFEYTRLADILNGELSRYFSAPALAYKKVQPPYNFFIDAKAYQHPLLTAFVPGLTRLDTVRLNAYLDNTRDTTLLATLKTGTVVYDTMTVSPSTVVLRAGNNRLNVSAQVAGFRSDGLSVGPTSLTGVAANNRLDFDAVSNDSLGAARFGMTGNVALVGRDNFRLQLNPRGLLANYERYEADSTGFVQYGPAGILAQNFSIRSTRRVRLPQGVSRAQLEGLGTLRPESNFQTLTLNSLEPRPNAPLQVRAQNISLSDLTRLAGQDSTLVGGLLNADVVLRDVLTNLTFTGDARVDSLEVMGKPVGTLTGKFANADAGRIRAEAALLGAGNDLRLDGYYAASSKTQPLDFRIDMRQLSTRTVEAFSFGELRNGQGQLRGTFALTGSPDKPNIQGAMTFDSVAFSVAQLGATYRIDQERLVFGGTNVTFTDFDVRDTTNNALTTNGTVTFANLDRVGYNLRVNADDFDVLNAKRKDNEYAYGHAAIDANLRIRGTGSSPSINGSLKLDDDSKVSVVLPDESLDANEAREVVTFIDHRDTLALAKYLIRTKPDTALRRLAFDNLDNSNIDLNIEVDEKSELTIVVDELNGDYLRARGNARLNVSLDAAGNVSVLGNYEVTEGEYSLTYQVLKRQFSIQKGSTITFTGDPLRADMNITAVYRTSARPSDLTANEVSGQTASRIKLPFDVRLSLRDNLAKPTITFDIVRTGADGSQFIGDSNPTPGNNPSGRGVDIGLVDAKLAQIRQDPSQLNKQVFALLVLGQFLSENGSNFFSGSGNGGGLGQSAENLARNSVSQLLSQQLQQFASGILKGFDVDFNLNSTAAFEGNSTGGSRTDLNVGLSRSFLNGRLTVQVGRNFTLENNTGISRNPNEVFDNVSLNYSITPDGRYLLRGYRRNDYQAALEGFVVETGVGFVITFDYNSLRELLGRRKKEEEERETPAQE